MSRTKEELSNLKNLGHHVTSYIFDYDPGILEAFDNQHSENEYVVTLDAYEFTTLCPMTGQPDFAKVFISYIPGKRLVESKSLKLYLFSFRNHGDFHEDCINTILNDLWDLMEPKYIEVFGVFTPRGGIAIYPFVSRSDSEHKEFEEKRKLEYLSSVHTLRRTTS